MAARLRALEEAARARTDLSEHRAAAAPPSAEDRARPRADHRAHARRTQPARPRPRQSRQPLPGRAQACSPAGRHRSTRLATELERDLGELGLAPGDLAGDRARRPGAPPRPPPCSRAWTATLAAIGATETRDQGAGARRCCSSRSASSQQTASVEDAAGPHRPGPGGTERPLLARDGAPLWAMRRLARHARRGARPRPRVDRRRPGRPPPLPAARIGRHPAPRPDLDRALGGASSTSCAGAQAQTPRIRALAEAVRIFEYPLSAALLVALFFSPWLYGELPRVVRTPAWASSGVVPVLRIVTRARAAAAAAELRRAHRLLRPRAPRRHRGGGAALRPARRSSARCSWPSVSSCLDAGSRRGGHGGRAPPGAVAGARARHARHHGGGPPCSPSSATYGSGGCWDPARCRSATRHGVLRRLSRGAWGCVAYALRTRPLAYLRLVAAATAR